MGMLWSLAKLSQKRIFHLFCIILSSFQISSKNSTNTMKIYSHILRECVSLYSIENLNSTESANGSTQNHKSQSHSNQIGNFLQYLSSEMERIVYLAKSGYTLIKEGSLNIEWCFSGIYSGARGLLMKLTACKRYESLSTDTNLLRYTTALIQACTNT